MFVPKHLRSVSSSIVVRMDATRVVPMRSARSEPSTKKEEMPAYRKFNDEILYWLRLLGHLLGLNVFDTEYRPNIITAINIFVLISCVSFMVSTALFSDGDFAIGANACIRMAFKVVWF